MSTRQQTPDILDQIFAVQPPAATPPPTTLVALDAIKNDGGTQMRAALNTETILEYEAALRESDGWPFPPVILFYDGSGYWLADGFHRVSAAHRLPVATIPADVRPGTRRDAVLFAAGANASHGLRRTNADKRRAVETLLRDEEWSKWSDSEIARRCLVDHKTVAALRKELEATWEIPKSDTRTGADGRTINTANIGAKGQPAVQDTPVWKLENVVREIWQVVAGDYNAARMDPELVIRTAYQSRNEIDSHGPFWMLCQKAADKSFNKGAFRYWRFSDMKQAINNVAEQMTQAALAKRNAAATGKSMLEVFQTDEERAIAAGEAAADEAARMVAAERAQAVPVPVSQRDDYDGDEWYTPTEYIEAARQVMGLIDLDPASSVLAQSVVKAEGYLAKEDDGLSYKWTAQTVWLNPPYSSPALWIEKLIREFEHGRTIQHAIVLVNNATETSWFQALLERYPVCLPAKRLAFWRHDQSGVTARQGQAFFYLGPHVDKFVTVFSQFGPVLRRIV